MLSCLGTAADQVEQFKRFMSHPPAEGRIVFAVRFANGTEHYHRYDWTKDSFLARSVPEPEHLFAESPPLLDTSFGGREGHTYWKLYVDSRHAIHPPRLMTWDSQHDGSFPTNSVMRSVKADLFQPNTVLCLGIMHLEPGTVTWEGNTFEARNGSNRFEGVLSTNQAGWVSQMILSASTDRLRRYIITYQYVGGNVEIPEWLPRSIQLSLVEDAGVRPIHRYTLWEASFRPLGAVSLNPDSIIQGRPVRLGVLRNDQVYVMRQGEMRRILNAHEIPAINFVEPSAKKRGGVQLLVFLMILLPPLVIMTRSLMARGRPIPNE